MKVRRLAGLALAAAAAIAFAACAPVDPDPSDDGPAPPQLPVGAEKLDKMPLPAPRPAGLRQRIEAAIDNARERQLDTNNGFWTVFHGILGLGPSLTLRHALTNERINAVDYICKGGKLRGLEFVPTEHGLDVRTLPGGGVGQGHQDQFIAEMAQWGMPANRKFVVFKKEYEFMDFVRHCQMRASLKKDQELSWAIVIIGQYIGTDASWTNEEGEKLHFEDLLRYELNANIDNAACGGTHRLFGLTWCYHLHLMKGGETTGVWKEIAEKTGKQRDLARKYQNSDGSFSTDFFRGPGSAPDKQRRINTTGHILEWLALALPEEELRDQWVEDAANALALMILDLQGASMEGGSLYHAVHGLLIYYARLHDRKWLGPNDPLIPLPPAWTKGK
jgi:hypothetical protein